MLLCVLTPTTALTVPLHTATSEHVKRTLNTQISMSDAVKLPEGEKEEVWLAMHITDFYNDINALYGAISEMCTAETCPVMSAGPKYTYLWADGVTIQVPIKVPAPDYIGYLMEWVDGQISNPKLMPSDPEAAFPADFRNQAKTIFKRLFRVYAHIYHSHFTQFAQLQLEKHLNTCFKRYVFFVKEFALVEDKELAPLQQLITSFLADGNGSASDNADSSDGSAPAPTFGARPPPPGEALEHRNRG